MKNPLSRSEIIARLEDEITRRVSARASVLDRIARNGYSINDRAGRSILRRAGRMAERIARLETELYTMTIQAA